MQFHSWVTSSLVRHFASTPAQQSRPLTLDAALNEQVSFQVAVRVEEADRVGIEVTAAGPAGWSLRVRRVGYVPVRHRDTPLRTGPEDTEVGGCIPGFVPDPLFDEARLLLPESETHAFWLTVRPGPGAKPGLHAVTVTVSPENGEPVVHTIGIRLHDIVIQKRTDFHITHWFYVDSLIDWYKTDLFDERFWLIVAPYMRNVVEHGQDTLYVPVFTPPLDGVKRPSQLLRVERIGPESYEFDWRDVRRYINLAKRSGITHFEWCHLFTQWGAEHPLRVYEGQGRDERLLWDPNLPATCDAYRAFLAQYLPRLRRFLEEEDILERSFFHVSDEPHGERHLDQYRQARGLLNELAPWMKVMDAQSQLDYARLGLTDMPIPAINVALDFLREHIPSWCYYCVGPRGKYLNHLLDTPLAKIAMHGFLFYRWPFQGFLHWGYNYWYQEMTRNLIDPYTVQDSLHWSKGWVHGDSFVVYPGSDGPVDSVRWEVIGESLQDYALLQTVGLDREHALLAPIKSFSEFPKTEAWRREIRARLFAQVGR